MSQNDEMPSAESPTSGTAPARGDPSVFEEAFATAPDLAHLTPAGPPRAGHVGRALLPSRRGRRRPSATSRGVRPDPRRAVQPLRVQGRRPLRIGRTRTHESRAANRDELGRHRGLVRRTRRGVGPRLRDGPPGAPGARAGRASRISAPVARPLPGRSCGDAAPCARSSATCCEPARPRERFDLIGGADRGHPRRGDGARHVQPHERVVRPAAQCLTRAVGRSVRRRGAAAGRRSLTGGRGGSDQAE